jgi:hypothetical protein
MTKLGWAFAAFALSASALCSAATTPEGTLKDFLKAAQKKDKPAIKKSIDWDALGKEMGVDKEKDPQRRKLMIERLRIVYVEGFAMGKEADVFSIGNVTTKKDEAKGMLMRTDAETKKKVPATEFSLHKVGKDWLIYNITAAKKDSPDRKEESDDKSSKK